MAESKQYFDYSKILSNDSTKCINCNNSLTKRQIRKRCKYCSIGCYKDIRNNFFNIIKQEQFNICEYASCFNICNFRDSKYCSEKCYHEDLAVHPEKTSNYGKSMSEEQKKKISDGGKGRIVTEDTKRKMSEANKKRIHKPLSDSHKLKLSLATKGIPKSEDTKRKMREAAVKRIINSKNNHYTSKAEREFVKIIEERYDVKLQKQFRIEHGVYDIKHENILIEVDGKYWHSTDDAQKRDKYKNRLAKKYGYKLYRFEVNRDKEAQKVIEQNKKLLDKIFGGLD